MAANQDSMLYDELPFWSAPFGIVLLDTVRYRPGIKVLDVGCGGGFPMLELADRLGEGSEVYGLDPSREILGMVNDKIRKRRTVNAIAVEGRAESMPFPDGHFDLIVSNNGMNNVDDQCIALKECRRVAKTGAQMVLTMNLPHTMTEFYEPLREVLLSSELPEVVEAMDQHVFEKRKPVEYLRVLILEAGFEICSVNVDGFKYRFAKAEAFFSHYLVHNFFLPAWKSFLPSGRQDEIIALVTKLLGKASPVEISVPFVCFDCKKK